MKVESVDGKVLGIGTDLVLLLQMAMNIYYETIESVVKEKDIDGTCEPIETKQFKGKGFFIRAYDKDISNLVTISKVIVGSFGVEIFMQGQKDSINISYDGIKLAIKND